MIAKQNAAQCGGCRHFSFTRQGNAARAGECRRNAPAPRTDGGPVADAAWPIVLETMSCGEFAPLVHTGPVDAGHGGGKKAKRTPRKTTTGAGNRQTRG